MESMPMEADTGVDQVDPLYVRTYSPSEAAQNEELEHEIKASAVPAPRPPALTESGSTKLGVDQVTPLYSSASP
jgi:hypothetical protein